MAVDAYPLAEALAARLAGRPDDPAVKSEGRWVARREIAALAGTVDARLRDGGVEAGHAVGLVLRNTPAGFAALVGLTAAGRPIALISPFQSAEAIAADVERLKLAGVVAEGRDWTPAVVAAARAAGSAGVDIGDPTAVAGLERRDFAADHVRAPDVAVLMLTSGTTGAPKRIPLSRRGLSMAIEDMVRMGLSMGEAPPEAGLEAVLIQYAPMVQLSGLFTALQAAFEAKPLALMEKFSVETWVEVLRECRPRMAALPPAMMRMVLEAGPPREALSSLRAVRSGAAPLDAHTREAFEAAYGVPVLSMYGATEFVGPVASWSVEDHVRFAAEKSGSVGRVWPDIAEARVVEAESGRVLAAGESGLLELRVGRAGPDWIRTNDLATLDADGFLFIHGRADDAINRGGFKIPPDVISDALRTHPAVYDAAAAALPDSRLGQIPVAAVELRPGWQGVTEDDILAYARSRLIAYQVPARILIVPALPRTPAQKISRPGVYALFGLPPGAAKPPFPPPN
jgi:long-chain acyl-CoA synthetase